MSEDQVRYEQNKALVQGSKREACTGAALGTNRLGVGEPVWRAVIINKVANGFIVHVGCKIFVANTWAQVSDGLIDYWDDPETAEKKYLMG